MAKKKDETEDAYIIRSRINATKYRKNNHVKVLQATKSHHDRIRNELIEILGNKCSVCNVIEGLNIACKDGRAYRFLNPEFKGAASTAYQYFRNNPKEATDVLTLYCLLHLKATFRGKKYNWTKEGIERKKISRSKTIFPLKDTKIEAIMKNKLIELGISFESHKVFGIRNSTHQVDIFIEPNICIELDGEYWHTRLIHKRSKYSPLHRDYVIDLELERRGYRVIRLWQYDIINNLEWCLSIIKKEMKKTYIAPKGSGIGRLIPISPIAHNTTPAIIM